ncbi:MAG: PAS domain S-box protein, partial [Sphingomonas taxi]
DSYVVEVTNMRADGTRFPVEVHSALIEHEGEPRIVAVARDLSSRADIERRYADLIESVDKGIVVQDSSDRVLQINSAAMRILGLAPGDSPLAGFISDRWLVVDEHGLPMTREQLPATVARTSGKVVESAVIGLFNLVSQQFWWLSVTSIPHFHPQSGSADQTVSMFSDITELKRDSAMFKRIQALAGIGGWEFNRNDAGIHLSDGAREMLGGAAISTLESFCARFNEQDGRRLAAAMIAAHEDSRPFTLDLRPMDDAEEERWLRVQGEVDRKDPSGRHVTGTLADITHNKLVENTLRRQARTDPLTGLLNRDAVLDELVAHLAGTAPRLAVLYIDLDRFKIINDVLGHNVGDRLLCAVAERLRNAAGGDALCARLGGDEFLVLCRMRTPDSHIQMAEAILAAIARPFRIDQEEFSISASIGITESPRDGTDASELIQNADAAMYDSKRRAYNGWQSYSEDLARRQRDRL